MESSASSSDQPSLDALILNATNPLSKNEDPIAVQAVVQAVCRDPSAPQNAVKILAHKMHSPQEREAMKALSVVQACVINCGPHFHAEIGKFRFLNEMIKLVSPKYAGNHTPQAIKSRVVELLFCWKTDLTDEPKVSDAYKMLRKQNVIDKDPVYIGPLTLKPSPRAATSTIEDTERSEELHRLLQSKRPEDLDRANALIQAMVRDDQKRIERNSEYAMKLEVARNNIKVLDDMLSNCESSQSSDTELCVMRELHQDCQSIRDDLYQTISVCADSNDDISEMISINDELTRVLGRYKVVADGRQGKVNQSETNDIQLKSEESSSSEVIPTSLSSDFLLDLSSPTEEEKKPSSDLISKELSELCLNSSNSLALESISSAPPCQTMNTNSLITTNEYLETKSNSNVFSKNLLEEELTVDSASINLLSCGLNKSDGLSEPMVPNSVIVPEKTEPSILTSESNSSTFSNPLDDLVILEGKSQFKQPVKLSMNEMKMKQKDTNILSSVTNAKTVTSVESKIEETVTAKANEEEPVKPSKKTQYLEVQALSDVTVAMTDIRPGNQSPLSLIDNGTVQTSLHYTLNSPRPDTSVFVLTTTSKSNAGLSQYVMQAVVPKACKVKLMAPSSSALSQYSPFLPPPAISQVMLIANPNQINVSLKLMLSYTVSDEPVTEMAEVENLFL